MSTHPGWRGKKGLDQIKTVSKTVGQSLRIYKSNQILHPAKQGLFTGAFKSTINQSYGDKLNTFLSGAKILQRKPAP